MENEHMSGHSSVLSKTSSSALQQLLKWMDTQPFVTNTLYRGCSSSSMSSLWQCHQTWSKRWFTFCVQTTQTTWFSSISHKKLLQQFVTAYVLFHGTATVPHHQSCWDCTSTIRTHPTTMPVVYAAAASAQGTSSCRDHHNDTITVKSTPAQGLVSTMKTAARSSLITHIHVWKCLTGMQVIVLQPLLHRGSMTTSTCHHPPLTRVGMACPQSVRSHQPCAGPLFAQTLIF